MTKGFRGAWLRSTKDPLRAALGPLERAVMDAVWQGGRLSVRDVQAQLGSPAAYTTVMTTLDRLFKKGLVLRARDGRAFLYTAAFERHELEAAMTAGLVTGMLAGGPGAARPFLSNLVDAVGDSDNSLLDELERLVREKRERIKDQSRDHPGDHRADHQDRPTKPRPAGSEDAP
jgi:predicted transcriptional regulator